MSFLYHVKIGCLIGCFVGLISALNAQSDLERKNSFLSGKRLLEQGLYSKSRQKLEPLSIGYSENSYNYSATYLYGLASFHLRDYYLTQIACENIIRTFPSKKQNDEVYYLWAQAYFAEGKYDEGYKTLEKIRRPQPFESEIKRMKKQNFLKENTEKLKKLSKSYPDDAILNEVLLFKMVRSAVNKKDWEVLDKLLKRSGKSTEIKKVEEIIPPKRKDNYTIAVVFPFNLDDQNNSPYARKPRPAQFAYDLFSGLELSQKRLDYLNIKVEIQAFDTKDDAEEIAKILASPNFQNVDLIIEPSATKFTPIFAQYAQTRNIGLIDILSYRPDLQDNPYVFSVMPSYETQAIQTQQFVKDSFPAQRAYIYYGEDRRDSLMANAYKSIIERNNGTVVVFKQLKNRRSSYHVFAQEMRGEPRGKGKSKAHFFVCSSDQSLAVNLLSAMQTSKVFAPIFTIEDWLSFPTLSMEQYDEAGIYFILPQYIDYEGLYVEDFNQAYYDKMQLIPSRYAYIGYETGHFFGTILKRYGSNFYNRIHNNLPEEGVLMPMFDYQNGNDNQFLPICRIIDGKLQLVNLPKKEKNTNEIPDDKK